jgi:hypothetical protein
VSIFNDDGPFDFGLWGCLITALVMAYVLNLFITYL